MKKLMLLFAVWMAVLTAKAQVRSPEQFLGYKIGTRFTPHWKLVSYFNYVSQQAPAMVKLEQYGLTNEGRPLIITIVASRENIINIEAIRRNNLRLANLVKDKVAAAENAPAIVWLSYNVHGNEASSSEAAMLTLYALVDTANVQTKKWLENTVVIIDPCLNPDGRDRYINWFNSVEGKNPDPDPESREHTEPWPGGRTNHYNFDLNRDWAWQSQLETQQRVSKYNSWLPHVHVDFHEQTYTQPYFFAPAAAPYHEVITSWQKEFQVMIGKNNARYFDQHGWLYFTKGGGYDLFYPSYGDTYPTYHGAIGMTFEQGGGAAGGLGVQLKDGDTLTLESRVAHHFTTALSTLEIASQNAVRLVREFHKFYSDAVTSGAGEYKTYLIKRSGTNADLEATLERYLRNNDITWGYARENAGYRGFNYVSNKEEPVTVEKNDIILTTFQPNGIMLKVLFEPKSRQAEVLSSPYDITAWSLPYALGLEAYAIRDKIIPGVAREDTLLANPVIDKAPGKSVYAYVIPWKHLSCAKVLARLIKAGVRVRYAEQPFSIGSKNYEAGTLLVTKAANSSFDEKLYDVVQDAAYKKGDFHFKVEPVYSGLVDRGFDLGSNRLRLIQPPKIAMLTGEGTDATASGTIWQFFDQQLEYPLSLFNANDMSKIELKRYNVLIMPNASMYRFLGDKTLNDQLKAWVRQGGKLIAMENAVDQLAKAGWGLKNKTDSELHADVDTTTDAYAAVKKYGNRLKDNLAEVNSGTIYKIQLDNTHPLGYGYPDYYFTLKQDDAVYEYIKEDGWNVGTLKKDNYVSGFLGSKVREELKDGLLFGVQEMGKGAVVYLADDVLFRSFWENGKLLFCNAVFLVGQ